ncbi:hypothetical protein RB598_002152 [Gaeumannomyces tritici]
MNGNSEAAPPSGQRTTAPIGSGYDYIVVGSGAGGMPAAARLAESGKKVLLIERGSVSTYQFGGRRRPAWLENTNLTRYDVPGLYNVIWHNHDGIRNADVGPITGRLLGGGPAINAGLWFRPQAADWDGIGNPEGWRAADMAGATERAFARVPWTERPAVDGVLHNTKVHELVTKGLAAKGWRAVVANDEPEAKQRTFAHAAHFFMDGERGGPLRTYLGEAADKHAGGNLEIWTDTTVTRLERRGDTVTGVQVDAVGEAGHSGVVKVGDGGRVILSAGVFGTAKILFRSGIGPRDQLEVVAGVEGGEMTPPSQWIELPVGQELDDHVNTAIAFEHPDIVHYDFDAAFDNPPRADAEKYLSGRSGILAQASPNINPVFWESIKGADGITRHFQWTSYTLGPQSGSGNNSAALHAGLGLGKTSRGRVTIDSSLNMGVGTMPYFNDEGNHDLEAVIETVAHVVEAVSAIPGVKMLEPAPGQDVREYVESIPVTIARTANHWVGTTRLGTDSGLEGGRAVVDVNAQVYGTRNLHVVDASIVNGIQTANPQAGIIIAAEKAIERILGLDN